ncbi:helix-turn-helix domain-containing protein [Chitinophaga flava]|uniref:HTH araC/xylS-type domain-containing protein n=1 Tax=Chitinophaga flava TaxID=2259036 RepID=A0A365XS93_9BACT|nr:helix-turn-helix domain-containing protein [Chitinophaga flava]RBL88891.1 hypothetical protein DF182_20285 [Chitinophaga flava]
MNATVQIPTAELREAIDYYWYHETDQLQQTSYNIPFLHQELVFNFGDAFTVTNQHQKMFGYDTAGSISGIFSGPVITRVSGQYKAIGIIFKPFGLYRLFGFSAAQFRDGLIQTDQLWDNKTADLIHQLEQQPSPIQKLQTLERFLLAHARPQQVPSIITDTRLHTSLEKGHIRSLQYAQQVSAKKYIQQFHHTVGSTPKRYAQLHLINASLAQIAQQPDLSLTEVAYEHGFYDQAHFIRVFKSFAGITPLQYKKAVQAGKVSTTFPNTILHH